MYSLTLGLNIFKMPIKGIIAEVEIGIVTIESYRGILQSILLTFRPSCLERIHSSKLYSSRMVSAQFKLVFILINKLSCKSIMPALTTSKSKEKAENK